MLEHRLQILLDDDRHRRITAAARERGVSVAAIVREAIDRGMSGPDERRRAAGLRLLAAPEAPAPEVGELLGELDRLRGREHA
ncbi:MAG TPA: CopG family transcriptional regulator [Friedmanniella sp.]